MIERHVIFEGGKRRIVEREAVPQDPAEKLARERERMRCTPVQMRLALHRAGRLDEVNAIVAANAEAGIVWEYAAEIERKSPLIEALKAGEFTDEQIDDLFRAAVQI